MARLSTFVHGELLTAARINSELTSEIPPTATALTSSMYLTLTDATNFKRGVSGTNQTSPDATTALEIIRDGLTVNFGGVLHVTPANYLPAAWRQFAALQPEFRPGRQRLLWVVGQDMRPVALQVSTDGALRLAGAAGSPAHGANYEVYLNASWAVPA